MTARLNVKELDLASIILRKLWLWRNNFVVNQMVMHPIEIIIEVKKEVDKYVLTHIKLSNLCEWKQI